MADENDLVKVHFELQEPDMGVSGESLWAAPVGFNLYELRNIPLHVRTVNWLDVVEAVPEAEDQWPEFVRVQKRSGHRTVQIYLLDAGQSRRAEILEKCNLLGATYEGMNNREYALDFAPEIDIVAAIKYFESLQDLEWADWRINDYG